MLLQSYDAWVLSGESIPDVSIPGIEASVWYRYVAPITGTVVINATAAFSVPVVVQVFTDAATLSALVPLTTLTGTNACGGLYFGSGFPYVALCVGVFGSTMMRVLQLFLFFKYCGSPLPSCQAIVVPAGSSLAVQVRMTLL